MADDPITGGIDATQRALCQPNYKNRTFQEITADADTSTASIPTSGCPETNCSVPSSPELVPRQRQGIMNFDD